MSTATRLLALRFASALANGVLILTATPLFVAGMLELWATLAALALALTWLCMVPATARLRAALEHHDELLIKRVDNRGFVLGASSNEGITEQQYARPGAIRLRSRVRKTLALPRDRFDAIHAGLATLVWLSFAGYIVSVAHA